MQKEHDALTRRDSGTSSPRQPAAATNETAPHYWYETQERAFAPGIADGWPTVIAAPHTKNGRLVRRNGDPSELLAALKAACQFIYPDVDRGPDVNGWHNTISFIEAAIAKAEAREAK